MLARLLRRAMVEGSTRAPRPLMLVLPPAIGAVAWAISSDKRQGVRENLLRVMPGEGRASRLFAEIGTFTSFARSMAEGVAVLSDPAYPVSVEIEGEAHLRDAMARGRGVVMLTAHTTGFEIAGGRLLRDLGRRVAFVMAREVDAGARRVSDEVRARAGIDVIHVGTDVLDALPVLRALRAGSLVGMHVDRVPRGSPASPPLLFGRALARGPLLVAARAGALAVPVLTRREGPFRVRVRALPAIELPRRATIVDVDRELAQLAMTLQAWIEVDPTAWTDWGETT